MLLFYVVFCAQDNSSNRYYIVVSDGDRSDTLFLLKRDDIIKVLWIYEDYNRYREEDSIKDRMIVSYRNIIKSKDELIMLLNENNRRVANTIDILTKEINMLKIENKKLTNKNYASRWLILGSFSIGIAFGVLLSNYR